MSAEADQGTSARVSGIDRIAAAFAGEGTAFMPYVMGGYPSVERSLEIGRAYAEAGADILELGVPYSDPLADGPVVHAAGTAALRAGTTVDSVLEICAALADTVPVVVMTYANVLIARGPTEFCAALREHGAAGLIVPDLPLEESQDVRDACARNELGFVPLVAPTTPPDRMAAIGAGATGFLYAVSVVGTTGEREGGDYAAVIAAAKRGSRAPVALGFGISTPEQAAAAAAAGADGVIVASRLLRAIAEGEDAAALAAGFAAALR